MSKKITKNERLESRPISKALIGALNSKPRFSSNKEAVEGLTSELEQIAQKLGVSIEQLIVDAEHSLTHKPLYIEALSLAREITHFRSSIE